MNRPDTDNRFRSSLDDDDLNDPATYVEELEEAIDTFDLRGPSAGTFKVLVLIWVKEFRRDTVGSWRLVILFVPIASTQGNYLLDVRRLQMDMGRISQLCGRSEGVKAMNQ